MRSILILAITLVACTKPNPNLCCVDASDCATVGLDEVKGCDEGLLCRGNQCIAEVCDTSGECDADAPYCVLIPDGRCQETCSDDIQCPGFGQAAEQTFCEVGACVECREGMDDCSGSTPVCAAGFCVGCTLNEQCASGACLFENGSCADESVIAYVDPTGTPTGECLQDAPCTTIEFALTLLPARTIIVIESGTYTRNATLSLTGARRLIGRGQTAPILRRNGIGPIVTAANGTISLERLEITGATGNPSGDDDQCAHGVLCAETLTPTIKFADTVVHTNLGNGIQGRRCTVEAIRTSFVDNGSSGVSLVDSNATIDRSMMSGNGARGAFLDAGVFVVTNSFVSRNATFGIELFTSGAGTRVEFNTIVDNGTVVSHSGLSCQSGPGGDVLRNNIIARNTTQTSASGCSFPDSIIIDNDIEPINFVSPDVAPFDYHIQAGSIAIDAASATTIDHDFDGDPRPSSGADVGADEL